jgi:hypothetical protein
LEKKEECCSKYISIEGGALMSISYYLMGPSSALNHPAISHSALILYLVLHHPWKASFLQNMIPGVSLPSSILHH